MKEQDQVEYKFDFLVAASDFGLAAKKVIEIRKSNSDITDEELMKLLKTIFMKNGK